TPTTHTLSLHDALPIYFLIDKAFSGQSGPLGAPQAAPQPASSTDTTQSASADVPPVTDPAPAPVVESSDASAGVVAPTVASASRSEEHTSELQSRSDLV